MWAVPSGTVHFILEKNMALYVICTNAVRSGNSITVDVNLMDDTPEPDIILESYTRTFPILQDGTNAEKRQDIRDRLIHWSKTLIEQRESADANATTIITQLINARYPPS